MKYEITEIPVTCLLDTQDKLGEGCFWDAATQCLWWLDLIAPSAIHRLHVASGAYRKWQFSEHVTAMAKRADGTILVGSQKGLNIFDPETGALSQWLAIDAGSPETAATTAPAMRWGASGSAP